MAADIVDDDGVRDAVLAELPGGQAGALVARPRLVDPDMNGNPVVMRAEHGGERGAPIDSGEPAGIAMSQDIDRRGAVLALPGGADEGAAMRTDRLIDRDILLANLGGAAIRRCDALGGRYRTQTILHVIERPSQIDRRRPCRGEDSAGF